MAEGELLGGVAIALVTLIGLFLTVHKPLNENTKAMTTLAIKVDQLTEQMRKQEDDFEKYKEHMSVSQSRQWDVINENTDKITEHDIIIKRMEADK